MENKDKVYLEDMAENITILEGFLVGVSKAEFLKDLEKQFAAARALEIVGEASFKLSEEVKNKHSEIDRRGLKSMRNLLTHEYAYVDSEEVWKASQTDVPDLKAKILEILKN